MTGSRLGLAVLVAVAMALAAFVITDSPPPPVTIDRAVLPGIDADTITELAWTLADGTRVTVTRPAAKQPWTFGADADRGRARVEAARVDAALAALRGGRWQRSLGRRAPLVAPTTQLVVTAGARTVTLGVAPAGAGQTWLVREGEALLVDDWLARALAPTLLELHQRRPLADIDSAASFTAKTYAPEVAFRIDRHVYLVREEDRFRIAPELGLELERSLAALELVALPTAPATGTPILAVRATLAEPVLVYIHALCTGAACPCPAETHLVLGDTGAGCIAKAQVDALVLLVKRFHAAATEIADPRAISIDPVTYFWGDDSDDKLSFSKQPTVHGRTWSGPASIERAVAIAAAMQIPGRLIPAPPRPARSERRSATDASGTDQAFSLLPGNVIHRTGEPVAIELPAQAFAALAWTAEEVRDGRLWIEEPTAIQSITVRELTTKPGRTLHSRTVIRGAVVGEWLADGQRLTGNQGAEIDRIAAMLAAPRAQEIIAPPTQLRYQVIVEVNPFPGGGGDPVVHGMRLAAPTAAGCPVTSDPLPGSLMERELCTAVAALLGGAP